MSMTSRERVLAAFNHTSTDRVPKWCGASPEFLAKARAELQLPDDESFFVRIGDDFRRIFTRYTGPAKPDTRTVFGVDRDGYGYGQPLNHPLAEATLQQVHDYPWPDPQWQDVSQLRADALVWDRQFAILGGDWSPFWHDAIDLFGMETIYYKMHDEPELVKAALQHIVDYYAAVSRRIFEEAADVIDVFFIGNDFGSQTGPLFGLELFSEFIVPHLERLIDLGHEFGLEVQMHSCGSIASLLPTLIAAGLDAIHALQPDCRDMDLAVLKARYGHQILLNGGIDSHHILIDGTPGFVRQQTLAILSIMAVGGGYVAGASHDYILADTPVANVLAMFDAVDEFSRS